MLKQGFEKDLRPLTASSQHETGALAGATTPEQVADAIVASLEDDKAEDILVLDLDGKSTIADQMIIASGRSARHVAALAEHLQRKIKEMGGRRARIEGLPNADWVLLDVGDVIVHIFRPEVREFYDLERIWSPAAGTSGHLRH